MLGNSRQCLSINRLVITAHFNRAPSTRAPISYFTGCEAVTLKLPSCAPVTQVPSPCFGTSSFPSSRFGTSNFHPMAADTGDALLRGAYTAAVRAVQPHHIILREVTRHGDVLTVRDSRHYLHNNVYLVGFGKAVINMVKPIEQLLTNDDQSCHLVEGIVSVPCGTCQSDIDTALLPAAHSRVRVMEGARDNIPDEDSHKAAQAIVDTLKRLQDDDLLIVCISGGGSALLPMPEPPVTMQEKQRIIKSLSRAGADIIELNTVRKVISAVKGGKLATKTKANVITLILSDVIGSPLDIIASGPTVANTDSPEAALDILTKYNVEIPASVRHVVSQQQRLDSNVFSHVSNYVIGDNSLALSAAAEHIKNYCCEKQNFNENNKVTPIETMIVSSCLRGDAADVGRSIAHLAEIIIKGYDYNNMEESFNKSCNDQHLHQTNDEDKNPHTEIRYDFINKEFTNPPAYRDKISVINPEFVIHHSSGYATIPESLLSTLCVEDGLLLRGTVDQCVRTNTPICLLLGGETTVTVTGNGRGGRNQELALSAAISLHEQRMESVASQSSSSGVVLLAGGTDGIDGPTPAAGAVVSWCADGGSLASLSMARSSLSNNDSYTFWRQHLDGRCLLLPGHTATNVMDVTFLLCWPRRHYNVL